MIRIRHISRHFHENKDSKSRLTRLIGKTSKAMRSGRTYFRTCDPEVSKAVLSKQFEKFGLQPLRYEGGKGFFGNGILVTDGLQWKHSRSLVRPAFDVAHVANFDRLRRHVERFIELLPRDQSTVDLYPLLKRLTLDISSEFIFGRSMNALSSPEACKGFMDAFMFAQRDVITPVAKRPKEYGEWCKTVLDYIDTCIDEAESRVQKPPQHTTQIRIVDELVKTIQDKHTLRSLIISIFCPAHDTVAVTLTNAFFHLARHPPCWAKLRAEILLTASQPLTYELLNSYKYLNWVLRETTVRECPCTTVLPTGGGPDGLAPFLIEKGDLIETNFRAQQRDASFWGADAEAFDPERWATTRPTWEYTPFSGGPRICPAFRLVYTESKYIMATMLRRFSGIENRDDVLEWVEEQRLIWQSRNGAKVALIL
ncbi:cytochrome P450 [Massariosphaeria phaeospora]|uniref:Cytochrome P450 n=1 Tax=Massariosphaeria phaeospora TaxID=100035 RepID=A0A7C8MBK3_9PLEO|nr:cytochrome P450 [Massariosphaeria phaeospora]